MQPKRQDLYEFGPFVLNTGEQTLTREGHPISLTPKTYDVLLLLVKNRGHLLTKKEIMDAAWPDSFVDESNLTQQVSLIRRALGEAANEARYIVTIPGRGYRFAAEVKHVPAPESVPPRSPKRRALLLSLAIAGIAGASALAVYITRSVTRPRTLAILPFQSIRNDPDSDFIGYSLANAIITKIDVLDSLIVRPSYAIEKYRRQPIDIPRAAAELRADTLLVGNFTREGNDLRVNTQLVDAPSQTILWNAVFEVKYDNLLTLEDKVAHEIVKGLKLRLSPRDRERLDLGKPANAAAYEYYLRGVDLYSKNEFSLAIEMLRRSSELDPSFAMTWSHLGRAHTANASFELAGSEEYRMALDAYRKALELQPSQIDAHVYMANLLTDTGKVESAVPLLREAARENPNHAEVHWELGYAYRFGGMLDASVAECEEARRLDPGVKATSSVFNSYLYQGKYDRFLESLPSENSGFILFYRGLGALYKKDGDRAKGDFDKAFAAHPTLLQARVGKALSHALRGENSQAATILGEIESRIAGKGVGDAEALYKVAQAYAVLGDTASGIRVLRLSVDNGFFCYPYLASDPLISNLRGRHEFAVILESARRRHEAFRAKFF